MQSARGRASAVIDLLIIVALGGCQQQINAPAPSFQAPAAGRGEQPIEVMHWLSSGAEASALKVIRDRFDRDGGRWHESAMPSVAAVNAAAMDRLLGGNGPEIFQVSVGSRLQELAKYGLVRPIPLNASELDVVLPDIIAHAAKRNGQYIAIPVDIVGENWLFYNEAVLARVGLQVPKSWDELLQACAALAASGKIPIALGGQPWQERILFNSIVLGVGGRTFYRRVYEQLDRNAMESTQMLEAFRIFGTLRKYVDEGSPGRPWNLATAMLIRGEAAFQFTGDWAKGELLAAGIEIGHGIGCTLTPAPDRAYVMAADAFAMSASASADALAGQVLFMRTVLDRDVQAAFNRVRGSIPARVDAPDAGFDICARLAMSVIRDREAQLVSTGLFGLSGGMSGAIDDAVSQFWNEPQMGAEEGRRLFVETVGAFK